MRITKPGKLTNTIKHQKLELHHCFSGVTRLLLKPCNSSVSIWKPVSYDISTFEIYVNNTVKGNIV